MAGQGSPTLRRPLSGRVVGFTMIALALSCTAEFPASVLAAEDAVRLRIAWGSGDAAKHRWFGSIGFSGGTLSELQPLGIESDAPAAVRLCDNQVVIEPLEKRGFDGCDLTVEGELTANLEISLRADQASEATVLRIPVVELLEGQTKQKIDSLGSFLLAYRAPGDQLRLILDRDNLVFDPGEVWKFKIRCDLPEATAEKPLLLESSLLTSDRQSVIWEATQEIPGDHSRDQLCTVEVACPVTGGAYQLSLVVRHPEGFTSKLVPGKQDKPLASRSIDMVVFDPTSASATLSDDWLSILSINPANPGWWQRLPNWVHIMKLGGKPTGASGNVYVRDISTAEVPQVELPPAASDVDPAWQSYTLPVLDVGAPHLLEVAYPAGVQQELEIAILEPDAAGRVSQVVGSGIHVDQTVESDWQKLKILFWPRSDTPQMLVVNRHTKLPGTYGTIELKRHDSAKSGPLLHGGPTFPQNLVGAYLARPHLALSVGASEQLDSASGMSVQTWTTFLQACQHTAQAVRLGGYNTLVASVAAEGSALYPSNFLMPSPRYDTGMLAGGGQDPLRKDVLELLLRACDAQQVRLIPTIQLSLPIPALENLRREQDPRMSGITLIGATGSELRGVSNSAGVPLYGYNLLNPRTQDAVLELVNELTVRCAQHPSFGGIALQIEGTGYGALPGMECGFDDDTVAKFLDDTKVTLPLDAVNTLQQRADAILNNARTEWIRWRVGRVTNFYTRLAEELRRHKSDAAIILLTDRYHNTPRARQALLRGAANGGMTYWDLENGLDFAALARIPGIRVSNTTHVAPASQLNQRPWTLVLNEAAERGDLLPRETPQVELAFHESQVEPLSSYDQLSQWGADKTRLLLAGQPLPLDSWRTRPFVNRLVTSTEMALLEGGDYLPLTIDAVHRRGLQTLQEIPPGLAESRPAEKQPVVIRTLRGSAETYLVAVNLSPWTVNARLQLTSPSEAKWIELGVSAGETVPHEKIVSGEQTWPVELAPFALRAWKFDSTNVKLGRLEVDLPASVIALLADQVAEVQSKAGNLNISRAYHQLQNPGFELQEGMARIFGWQSQRSTSGNARIDASTILSGQRALQVESFDNKGTVVQSHLFPISDTGMLILGAHFCLQNANEDSQIRMSLESEDEGQTYRREIMLTPADLPSNRWTAHELVVRDLPLRQAAQLRVKFHVVGHTRVLLDDVKLHDLRFDEQQRGEIVKRVYAAKIALDGMRVVDCHRLLNGYWSRFLAEHVPPTAPPAIPVVRAEEETPNPPKEEEPRVGHSFRSWIPKIWR